MEVICSFNITPKKRTAVVLLINNRPRTLYIESLKRDTIELGEQRVPAIMAYETRMRRLEEAVFNKAS